MWGSRDLVCRAGSLTISVRRGGSIFLLKTLLDILIAVGVPVFRRLPIVDLLEERRKAINMCFFVVQQSVQTIAGIRLSLLFT